MKTEEIIYSMIILLFLKKILLGDINLAKWIFKGKKYKRDYDEWQKLKP